MEKQDENENTARKHFVDPMNHKIEAFPAKV
jgi:hypothetical protein